MGGLQIFFFIITNLIPTVQHGNTFSEYSMSPQADQNFQQNKGKCARVSWIPKGPIIVGSIKLFYLLSDPYYIW